jgi:arsenate reductase (thioredoxin)
MRKVLATVAITLVAGTVTAGAQTPPARIAGRDTIRVVFVCVHGSVKSLIAASLFNRLAAERGLVARAISRGAVPDTVVPQLVRDGLLADGVDIGNVRPQRLGLSDGRRADILVTFDVDLPSAVQSAAPVRRWDGTPSVMRAYPVGRDSIAARVARLVAELERTEGRRVRSPRRQR